MAAGNTGLNPMAMNSGAATSASSMDGMQGAAGAGSSGMGGYGGLGARGGAGMQQQQQQSLQGGGLQLPGESWEGGEDCGGGARAGQ